MLKQVIFLTYTVVVYSGVRWAGNVARMEYRRGAYTILVRRPDGRRPRGKPKRRWEHNIKVNIQEVE
jgi:hypothetical protein